MTEQARKPRINSRQKGARFERLVASELFDLTGIRFKRDLDQYRERARGDLVPDNPNWPFLLELKHYAKGTGCRPEWREQAVDAAMRDNRWPAVVFKFDGRPVRVSVPFCAIAFARTGLAGESAPGVMMWADVDLDGLAWLAREMMAREVGA